MNKVDLMVKKLLLAYPSLYKSRAEVIHSIFFVSGAGYAWDENGCVFNEYGTPDVSEMKFDDLDKRQKELEEDKHLHISALSGLNALHKAEIEIERATRKIIASNIDVFASEKSGQQEAKQQLRVPDHISQYSILSTAPYGNIDKDWLAALEEALENTRGAFNRDYSLHYDNPPAGDKKPEPSMFSRMPEKHQKVWRALEEFENKADAQSGTKARRAEMIKLILGELNKDN